MIRKCKKLVTDIGRKAELDRNIPEYADLLEKQYDFYSVVKMCMNYFTMKSMLEDEPDIEPDVKTMYADVTRLIKEHIADEKEITQEAIECIDGIRHKIEYKMKLLTAYTDGLQIYEYILNRIEAKVKACIQQVDADLLAQKMYAYVFSENDTVVVNSKLKLLIEQLPVRMTKNKFYDVITNTLTIYKGGDRASVDEFVDMLKTAVLMETPEGFETEYPMLYSAYMELKTADYTAIGEAEYDRLMDLLDTSAASINASASAYMLLQEIVNDVYAILLTHTGGAIANAGQTGYDAAIAILCEAVKDISVDELNDELMSRFILLEGVQEEVYESIMVLETALDDLKKMEEAKGLTDRINTLEKVQRLLSTSLFVALDRDFEASASETADNDYIMKLRDEMVELLKKLFADNGRMVNRSIMCKLLASMPVFLNTKQDIQNYFQYVLNNCNDDSELTACKKLIEEIIEE